MISSESDDRLLAELIDLPIAERESFLSRTCGNDTVMRQRLVEKLEHLMDSLSASVPAGDTPVGSSRSVIAHALAAGLDVLEKPGTIIGRYRLIERIGEGGCGVVYLAEQQQPVRRQVALKLIKLGLDTREFVARFEAERQALAVMEHPNIARVFDASATEVGRPYFVMELVRGIPITRYCDENNLPLRDRLLLFISVCEAVQHAHQKGVIHRDLKPSNILVVEPDSVGEGLPREDRGPESDCDVKPLLRSQSSDRVVGVPKIIDFGIAKAMGAAVDEQTQFTQFHSFIGTPAYSSPEQMEMSGLDVDTRTDVYSLGVLLYELLTSRTPFDSQDLLRSGLDGMRKTIRETEPPRPSHRLHTTSHGELHEIAVRRGSEPPKLVHRLRGDLDWIVMKCLEKDRIRRYETANGLAADLRRHLNDEPVAARPPRAGYRAQKFVQRNKTGVIAAAAAVLLLVTAVVGTSLGFVRAARTARELEASLYIHRVALAHRELTGEPRNIAEAEKLLDACKPALRSWEWNYLKRHWLVEPTVLRSPSNRSISSLSLSSDDKFLASAGEDGFVTIWDFETGRVVQSIPGHTSGFASSVAFDPTNPDRVVSIGSDKEIKLWNWRTKTKIRSWPLHFSFEWGMAYSVAFSPDGKQIAAASAFDTIKIWNADTGVELVSLSGHEAAAFSLTFSPDCRQLAVGTSNGSVRLWESATGRLVQVLGGKSDPVACVAYSPDGKRLAGAHFNGAVRLWDIASGLELSKVDAHTGHAVALAFTPDGRRLATTGHDRAVKLWDATSSNQVLTLRDFSKEATCVVFSRDGMRLAVASLDGSIRIFDATPLRSAEGKGLLTFSLPVFTLGAMEFARDGSVGIAAGGPRQGKPGDQVPIFFCDTSTGMKTEMLSDYSGFIFSLSLSPDGRFLASTGDDSGKEKMFRIKVWDRATQQLAFTTEGVRGDGVLFSVAYSPDGKSIVAGGHQGKIVVWDATTGRTTGIMGEHGRDRTIFNLTFSPDGRYLGTVGQDGSVRVWDGKHLDGRQDDPAEFVGAGADYTDTLAFSPDGSRVVLARNDRTAVVWDVGSKQEVLLLSVDRAHAFRALAYSQDGHWIASGGVDAAIHIWNASTGELVHTFMGHIGEVIRLRFVLASDGLRLVSGSRDCTLKFWDMGPIERAGPR